MRRVFLTGGGGFIGSRLLAALAQRGYSVVALDRSGRVGHGAVPGSVEVVRGDLLVPETYRSSLAGADAVVHLAAATGRAPADEHQRVNANGTETLLRECRAAGVERFLFVSSIAATFHDLAGYPYAQAKVSAERTVAASGIRFAIVRPTMVLGQGSPILAALSKLAALPVIPVFGDGRTPVQPVSVDDLVAVILTVLERDLFSGETIEAGGPDRVPIEELLQTIRVARTGRRGAVLHVPLNVMLPVLRTAEAVGVGPALPFSVGQLATFRFAGTAADHPLIESPAQHRAGLDAMLSPAVPPAVSPAVSAPPKAERSSEALGAECRAFTRHLIGCDPSPGIVDHYQRAHSVSRKFEPDDPFDEFLAGFAARHRVLARFADSYARIFAPASLLRRKLVLLLAILETASPTFQMIDQPPPGGRTLVVARLVGEGLLWIGGLLAAVAFLVPARLAIGHRRSR